MALDFDPSTFWQEVRRYGVTVATYTWTLPRDLVDAPPDPGERHHSLRLFIGSGMPRGLWKRVEERFAPARVLEFYASTEAGAILVNLRDVKTGAMGRPLPGSSEVRIAEYDLDALGLVIGRSGFVTECGVEEIGMLLVRVHPGEPLSVVPLRSVFGAEDAWLATGDLFRRDADGDYWRVDGIADVIRTADGPVFTTAIRDALWDLPAVDMAVAYGIKPPGSTHDVAVAAVTLRQGLELSARDVGRTLSSLPTDGRPLIVQVVDEIPVTTWFRPITAPLRAAGIPEPGEGRQVWYRDAGAVTYRPMSDAAHRRLFGQPAEAQRPASAGSVSPE